MDVVDMKEKLGENGQMQIFYLVSLSFQGAMASWRNLFINIFCGCSALSMSLQYEPLWSN